MISFDQAQKMQNAKDKTCKLIEIKGTIVGDDSQLID